MMCAFDRDAEWARYFAGREEIRIIDSSAGHWIMVGACVGVLMGIVVVGFALHVGGVL